MRLLNVIIEWKEIGIICCIVILLTILFGRYIGSRLSKINKLINLEKYDEALSNANKLVKITSYSLIKEYLYLDIGFVYLIKGNIEMGNIYFEKVKKKNAVFVK